MFGLFVRFTCKDEAAAEAYDKLVAETIEAIKTDEPGTLVYASHIVEGQPLQRISTSYTGTGPRSRRTRHPRIPAATWRRGASTWPVPRWTG